MAGKKKSEKKPKEAFRIYTKRSGRFYVEHKGGKPINGEEKVKILLAAGKIKAMKPKAKAAAAE